MASGGWGPGPGSGQPGGNGPGGQGWGAPYGPNNPYGPNSGGNPYGTPPPQPGPYPNQPPYPQPNPYPYGPQPTRPAARRRSGCLSFGLVGAILRSAHRVATRLFNAEGDGRIVDRTVDRVQVARTVLGAAATIGLILAYNVKPDRWEDAAYGGAAQLILAPFVLIIAAPLVIIGFIYYAPSHLRPHLRSRLRAPLKAVAWYVLTLVVIGGIFTLTAKVANYEDGKDYWWEYVLAVTCLIVFVWGFPFFFMASLYSARSAFNTAQVHPMLPPVLTTTLVWVFAALSLTDGLPAGPPLVQFSSALGGPLSVTAVSLWELRRMKTRFGVTLRT